MDIFNARLSIRNAYMVGDGTWQLDATLVDNSGNYNPYYIQADDVIYCTGMSQFTYTNSVCRYKVFSVDQTTIIGSDFSCIIVWDQTDTDYADPQPGYDASVGRGLQNGIGAVTTQDNGVGPALPTLARNVDFANTTFGGTGSIKFMQSKYLVTDIAKRDFTVPFSIIEGSEFFTMNGLLLERGSSNDYTVDNNRIVLTDDVEITPGDIFAVRYMPAA